MCKLQVDSIRKNFGSKQILTDIFLTCKKGEIIGLLGRNGTGKSTLLKIIFGSVSAQNKFVKVDEKLCNSLSDNIKTIKYLPQNNFLPKNVKVKTIINIFCTKANAKAIKNKSTIKACLHKKISHLSSGELRLLEIFLIVYSQSKFTLLDEPFNGIAPIQKEVIKALIKEQSANQGFIITDHDYRNVIDIATRLLLIHDGGIKEIKSKKELVDWGYVSD